MYKPKPHVPARLHFFFAREAPIGVIFREGPPRRIRLILWHTDTDTFEPGHWFLGQISGASLSPDGKLLIYMAYKWHQNFGIYAEAWVAISKPPYLTALALWWTGRSRGGGIFLDNQTVELQGWLAVASEPDPNYPLAPWLKIQKQSLDAPCKMLMGGWRPLPGSQNESFEGGSWEKHTFFFERGWENGLPGRPERFYEQPLPGTGKRFFLRMDMGSSSRSGRPPRYALYDDDTKTSQALDAYQAELDPKGRLVLARDGKLLAATVHEDASLTTVELADFNDMEFEAIPPPEWATHW